MAFSVVAFAVSLFLDTSSSSLGRVGAGISSACLSETTCKSRALGRLSSSNSSRRPNVSGIKRHASPRHSRDSADPKSLNGGQSFSTVGAQGAYSRAALSSSSISTGSNSPTAKSAREISSPLHRGQSQFSRVFPVSLLTPTHRPWNHSSHLSQPSINVPSLAPPQRQCRQPLSSIAFARQVVSGTSNGSAEDPKSRLFRTSMLNGLVSPGLGVSALRALTCHWYVRCIIDLSILIVFSSERVIDEQVVMTCCISFSVDFFAKVDIANEAQHMHLKALAT